MNLRSKLERRRWEVVVTQSVLDRLPKRRIAGQLLRIEVERQDDLSLSPLCETCLGIDPVSHRVPCGESNERRPVVLGPVRKNSSHVRGEPVRLSRIVERWAE